MRITKNWKDFEVLDASRGERLERWGNTLLIRPDPQVIWNTPRSADWDRADARYRRSSEGGGSWEVKTLPKDEWTISYERLGLRFRIQPTGFKHTGLFPEQASNWELLDKLCRGRAAGGQPEVLNLFAYTGGATLACAAAGARVAHLDAAKGMVGWARQNAELSGLADKPVRWLVDDCLKFVQREKRRGRRYDGMIMDPPSYGRGPGGEVWKLEESLYGFLEACVELLDADSRFLMLNSYTTGLSPAVMHYMLEALLRRRFGGRVESWELGLPVRSSGGVLPCGSTALWLRDGLDLEL